MTIENESFGKESDICSLLLSTVNLINRSGKSTAAKDALALRVSRHSESIKLKHTLIQLITRIHDLSHISHL